MNIVACILISIACGCYTVWNIVDLFLKFKVSKKVSEPLNVVVVDSTKCLYCGRKIPRNYSSNNCRYCGALLPGKSYLEEDVEEGSCYEEEC